MIELVTADGWKFYSKAVVRIGDTEYDMDELTDKQKQLVRGGLQEQGLNAAYAGKAAFKAKGLPSFGEAFPQSP